MSRERNEDRDRRLEDELRDLGSRIEYPTTPDLARAARLRLEEDEAQPPPRRWSWTPFLSPRWAVAAVLVLVAIAPILSPGIRDSVGNLFVTGQDAGSAAGGDAAQSEERAADKEAPSSLAESSKTESGGMRAAGGSAVPESGSSLGRLHAERLGLEVEVSLREARESGPVLVPRATKLGEPDGVYVTGSSRDGGVVLVYRAGPGLPPLGDTNVGLILTELPGDLASAYLSHETGPGPREVSVGGARGYWAASGQSASVKRTGDLRAGALLWEQDGRALRLESGLPQREAIQLAASVR